MPDIDAAKAPSTDDRAILLGVLSAVESDARVTQRRLSRELGIALGLTNAYLRRCVHKGWVKIGQVPMHRYAYYLTPQGFREKARLTAEYLSWSLEFFRRARTDATEVFTAARARGVTRFVLVGAGDLAEVVVLSALDAEVVVIAVFDPEATASHCVGRPVLASLDALKAHVAEQGAAVNGLVVTGTRDPFAALALAHQVAGAFDIPIDPERIILPRVLKLSWPKTLIDDGGAGA